MLLGRTSSLSLAIAGLAAACGAGPSNGGSVTGGNSGTGGPAMAGNTSSTGGAGSGGITSAAGGSHAGGTGAGGAASGGSPGTGGAGGVASPSCQASGPGISDCGGGESCCTSLGVPGGTFYRTYTNDGSGAADMADPATISDFRLDKYLVTVGRFRKFVAAWDGGTGYTPEPGAGRHTHLNGGKGLADSGAAGAYETGWKESDNGRLALDNDSLACQSGSSTWTNDPGDNEQLPMNCVNWWEACAFCIWDGGFLPSEAEYVYAAAGGSEQRRFPWGSEEPGTDNRRAIYGCHYGPSGTCDNSISHIAPVGTAREGAGRWGQLDLVGNLMEWYLDWFAPSYANPCTDCANLASGSGRAPRDGYFSSTDTALLLAAYRNNGLYPANRFFSFGFRCARAP
jgi:sulfatase modifying factor 1